MGCKSPGGKYLHPASGARGFWPGKRGAVFSTPLTTELKGFLLQRVPREMRPEEMMGVEGGGGGGRCGGRDGGGVLCAQSGSEDGG